MNKKVISVQLVLYPDVFTTFKSEVYRRGHTIGSYLSELVIEHTQAMESETKLFLTKRKDNEN
jgi:hypothetical protein